MDQRQRQRNRGLRKVCGCARRAWLKCPHAWYLNFQHRGTPYRISLDKHAGEPLDKSEALALAERLKTDIRHGAYPPAAAPVAAPTVTPEAETFSTFGALWLTRERASRTADRYELATLGAVALEDGSTLGGRPIGRITADDLAAVFRVLAGRGLAGSTVNKHLQTCLHLQRWGVRQGYLTRPWFTRDTQPWTRVKAVQRRRRLEPERRDARGLLVAESEERRLLAAASPWLQRLILAALETGMRRGELLKLQWKHVDLARGRIHLPADLTKTATGRTIVVSARLRAVLALVRQSPLTGTEAEAGAHVFGNGAGERVANPSKLWEGCILRAHGVTPTWTRGKLSAAARAALRRIDLHFHDLRHEAGSRWVEAGWPVHHVQTMLGHANLAQTSTYLNTTVHGLEDSMRKLDAQRDLQQLALGAANDVPPSGKPTATTAAKSLVN